jgi:hypothetical protein
MTTLRGIAQPADYLLTHMLLAYWRGLLVRVGGYRFVAFFPFLVALSRSSDLLYAAAAFVPFHGELAC